MNLQRQKLINAVVYFSQHTKQCGKTKLVKLLYYLDFMHFREAAKPVTGLKYSAWQFGPYPVEFARELENPPKDLSSAVLLQKSETSKFAGIKARAKFDANVFSKRELKLLERIAFVFAEARAEDMVEASHLPNHPWDKTIKTKGERAEIDYMLAFDTEEGSLPIEEALERVRDREELSDLLDP